jgi:UDP-glucose 4-epimerase
VAVVLDNLSTGSRSQVPEDAVFVVGDIANRQLVRELIAAYRIDAVIHFAGSIIVPESVQVPLKYYANNTINSHALIQTCIEMSVKIFVFSSTAAVYGVPNTPNVDEETHQIPINPYGRSKLMTEWMLADASRAHDFRHIILRYFNVAGADPYGRTGQSNPSATHLIKRATQAALGRVPYLEIFGTDYPTPDGTGIRDYIHVTDLVDAHLLALDALRAGEQSSIFNCGYGRGLSVREIVRSVEQVTGCPLAVREGPRRSGDPPMIVANSTRLKQTLQWVPKYEDPNVIIASALEWERRFNS